MHVRKQQMVCWFASLSNSKPSGGAISSNRLCFAVAGNPFELTMGREPRKIKLNGRDCLIQADKENREILIDGTCYYRVGEPVRNVYIAGMKHTIYYQGPYVNIWIDSIQVGWSLKTSYYSLAKIVFVVVLLIWKAVGWENDLALLRDNNWLWYLCEWTVRVSNLVYTYLDILA